MIVMLDDTKYTNKRSDGTSPSSPSVTIIDFTDIVII